MAGVLSDVTGAGEAIEGGAKIASTFEDFLFRAFPNLDKAKAADTAKELEELTLNLAAQQNQGQLEINKVEAASSNVFVSGWRPAIGWVCAACLAWNYLFGPIAMSIAVAWGCDVTTWPQLNGAEITGLTASLLGMGAYRTWEKTQGVEPPTTPVISTKRVLKALPVK